jgi:ketosteroid isomerase-like protein
VVDDAPEDNAAVVRRAYDAFARRDLKTAPALLDPQSLRSRRTRSAATTRAGGSFMIAREP